MKLLNKIIPQKVCNNIMFFVVSCIIVLVLYSGCSGEKGDTGPAGPAGSAGSAESADDVVNPTAVVPDDFDNIQEAIDTLGSDGGSILIRAGVYTLFQGIHINRSNVSLTGERGTVLRLDDEVQQPVIIVGTDDETPVQRISNIEIENIEIDGNKENQTSEVDPDRPWIRNNAIDVRMVDFLWISDVNLHSARSGALVVSWDSNFIFVSNATFHHCSFDGIALYDSTEIHVSNFSSYQNDFAGLSLDNQLENIIFVGGLIRNNGDVGIFARNSNDISFYDLMITSNGFHGAFLSHDTPGTNTGVHRLLFDSCSFLDNNGWGFMLASTNEDSENNAVIGCLFSGNTAGAINVADGGSLDQEGNVFQ